MADHSLNALHAAARAMEEVVLPAIDAQHPLAREQAGLVLRYLRLFEQRLDHAYQRNRFEVARACELGQALMLPAFDVSPAITNALREAVKTGQQLLETTSARPSALRSAATELGQLATALVRTLAAVKPEASSQVERLVLEKSGAWLDMQRAWFLPQGWEPDPSAVPSIDALL
ncbi:MAG: hypothetical protein NVSMB34_04990 [Variovorax sp.]